MARAAPTEVDCPFCGIRCDWIDTGETSARTSQLHHLKYFQCPNCGRRTTKQTERNKAAQCVREGPFFLPQEAADREAPATLVGRRYGKLLVLERHGEIKSELGKQDWLVQCQECGEKLIYQGKSLCAVKNPPCKCEGATGYHRRGKIVEGSDALKAELLPCIYNGTVQCARTSCEGCGWNPEVVRHRKYLMRRDRNNEKRFRAAAKLIEAQNAGKKPCAYQEGIVDCPGINCDRCGWNPRVVAKRKLALHPE